MVVWENNVQVTGTSFVVDYAAHANYTFSYKWCKIGENIKSPVKFGLCEQKEGEPAISFKKLTSFEIDIFLASVPEP